MTSGEVPNTLWARAFVDELARAGVRDVCVAPGSRSTPLVLAFGKHGAFRLRVHLDERSAGFFAVGIGKATGVPAVVLTTSGTATANVFPAVMEAAQGETPLLVLTADRPHRLRDADANQAVDQLRLYGSFVREFFEVGPAVADGPALRHLRTLAGRAVAEAFGAPVGPVHLNFPFDRPLEPQAESPAARAAAADFAERYPRAATGRPEGAPYVYVAPRRPLVPEAELAALTRLVRSARRPLLVAGPVADPEALGPAAVRFGAIAGVPVLADPLSGARFHPSAGGHVSSAYDLFLREERVRAALAPDLVIRVGRSPTSAALLDFLDCCDAAEHVVIDPSHRWKDHLALATRVLRGDAADALTRLEDLIAAERNVLGSAGVQTGAAPGDADDEGAVQQEAGWTTLWSRLEQVSEEALADALAGEPFEGLVAREVVHAMPPGSTLFVASSMPVRDLDAFSGVRDVPVRVLGNRGTSGIDGIVSTTLGVAAGIGAPVVALLGDLALFHDSNGLLAAREPDVRAIFVVVNNDGGGIFHFLPIRQHEPHFTRLFATPHGLDPARLAALYDLPHERVPPAGVRKRLHAALAAGGSRVLEVRSDREANRTRRDEVIEAVRAAAAVHLSPTEGT